MNTSEIAKVLTHQLTNLEQVLATCSSLKHEDICKISESVGVLKMLIAVFKESK